MAHEEQYFSHLCSRVAIERERWSDQETTEQRRKRLRAALLEGLGKFTASKPLTADMLERVKLDGYMREKWLIGSTEELKVPIYLLLPEKQGHQEHINRRPAIVALHGHGYGVGEAIGLTPDGAQRSGNSGIHADFALSLVRRGFVTVVPEIIGFGNRRLQREREAGIVKSCFPMAAKLLMLGKTLAGLRVFETIRTIDWLLEREDVDPQRVGMMGFSGGALIAAYVSALDERVQATVLCGFTSLFEGSILASDHCIDNYVPGLLVNGELPDYIGLTAPRPLFVESGIEDRLFPIDSVRSALDQLKRIYAQTESPDALASDLHPGGHEISGRLAYDWLKRQLKA